MPEASTHVALLDAIAAARAAGAPFPITGEDGLAAARVIDAAYESARTGRTVSPVRVAFYYGTLREPNDQTNPYGNLLADALARHGVEVEYVLEHSEAWLRANASRFDVMHWHWPSHEYVDPDSRAETERRMAEFVDELRLARTLGLRIVWTAHNLYPHDRTFHDVDVEFRHRFVELVTAIVSHCDAAADAVRREFHPPAPMFVIPHGNFIDVLPPSVSREEERAALGIPDDDFVYGFIGNLLPYKGLEELVDTFRKRRPRQIRGCSSAAERGRANTASRSPRAPPAIPRIVVRTYDYAPGEAFVRVLQASEVIVLPFRASTTSGSLVQALSWPRPCIVPDMGCLPTQMDADAGILYPPDEHAAWSGRFARRAGSTWRPRGRRPGGRPFAPTGTTSRADTSRRTRHERRCAGALRAAFPSAAGWRRCAHAAPRRPSPTPAPRSTSGSTATTGSFRTCRPARPATTTSSSARDHAVQLVFNPRDGHHHACPVDGEVFSGEPFDSAWGWSVNDALSDAALRASVRRAPGFGPGRARADADLLRLVLLGYAERYRTMPPAPQGPSRRLQRHRLLERARRSVWIIRLVWAAALSRDLFTADEQAFLRVGLFQPALDQLLAVRYRQIQNVGNWDRGAILALGLLLDDEAPIDEAIDGEYGIRDQLTRGVTTDGLWWELSLSYHFYVLGAVPGRCAPSGRPGGPSTARTWCGACSRRRWTSRFPDTTLPATNDCWYHIGLTGEVGHGIPNADGFYEMAFGWFGNPMFAWVVGENRRRNGPRRTMEGLLDGAPDLPMVKRARRHPASSTAAAWRCSGGGGDSRRRAPEGVAGRRGRPRAPDQLGVALFAGSGLRSTPGRRATASRSTTPGTGRQLPIPRCSWTPGRSRPAMHGSRAGRRESRRDRPGGRDHLAGRGRVARRRPASRRGLVARPGPVHRLCGRPGPTPARAATRRADRHGHRRVTGTPFDRPRPAVARRRGAGQRGERGRHVHIGRGTRARLRVRHLTDPRALPPDAVLLADLPNGRIRVDFGADQAADDARILASAPGNPAADRHAVLLRRRTASTTTFVTTLTWDFTGRAVALLLLKLGLTPGPSASRRSFAPVGPGDGWPGHRAAADVGAGPAGPRARPGHAIRGRRNAGWFRRDRRGRDVLPLLRVGGAAIAVVVRAGGRRPGLRRRDGEYARVPRGHDVLLMGVALAPAGRPRTAAGADRAARRLGHAVVGPAGPDGRRRGVGPRHYVVLDGHRAAQLSGLFATFPVFITVLAVFTHRREGPARANLLLRGALAWGCLPRLRSSW